ncbi:hypothetical protein AJ80_01133 [Polytolypa hystricis UAMH7299]|uniref:SMODS and SLOG-associating 2TM effector domain-containing protein n=1 Tax=Polytolypa hystricis (strain UAMH7299) TaxID=1447883 RepID=A0A2B7YZR4_POLH7|nr:hypothetical protein AJ80_01133 [Polytolypa hystricis UAMH7299]
MRRFKSVLGLEEKGFPEATVLPTHHNGTTLDLESGRSMGESRTGIPESSETPRKPDPQIGSNDKLLAFRVLTGIDSVPSLRAAHGLFHDRSAPNVGIYARVVTAERTAASRYRIFSILINACLGVQIVVAASLTALGAAGGPRSAVVAFGAINTVMAGILTYLKGTGLPHKEKSHEHKWTKVREYIEQREREFCLRDCMLDVEEEIALMEDMFLDAKATMEESSRDRPSRERGKRDGGVGAGGGLRRESRASLPEVPEPAAHPREMDREKERARRSTPPFWSEKKEEMM